MNITCNTTVSSTATLLPPEVKKNAKAPSAAVKIDSSLRTIAPSFWLEMAQQYDVRNMPADDLAEMSLKLYKRGAISLLDHAILSLKAIDTPEASSYMTKADRAGNRDWIAEFEARLEISMKEGDSRFVENDNRLLSYLKMLDAAKSRPVDTAA